LTAARLKIANGIHVLYSQKTARYLKVKFSFQCVCVLKNTTQIKQIRMSLLLVLLHIYQVFKYVKKTDERESPQEAKPARENSSLGFIKAVHQ